MRNRKRPRRTPSTPSIWLIVWVFAASAAPAVAVVAQGRPRARDLGIVVGIYPSGPGNAITDVDGVRVGHTTIVEGDRVRTGVTAIVPHGGNVFQDEVAGAVFVGTAMDAVVRYTIAQPGNEKVRSVNALVGETNDGGLNDIRGLHVTREHVIAAMTGATAGPVAEGTVGAGTGTINYGWKGGIGTSSRRVAPSPADGREARAGREYTVGVLAQTNFGGNLTIAGVPIFRSLQPPRARDAAFDNRDRVGAPFTGPANVGGRASEDGSCMLVVATDAPLDARDLRRLAARAIFGLARTGSSYSNGSGDFAIAFSTSTEMRARFNETTTRARTILPPDATSPLFEAALEATEEAVYNALLKATTVRSANGTAEAIPIDRVRELLKR